MKNQIDSGRFKMIVNKDKLKNMARTGEIDENDIQRLTKVYQIVKKAEDRAIRMK